MRARFAALVLLSAVALAPPTRPPDPPKNVATLDISAVTHPPDVMRVDTVYVVLDQVTVERAIPTAELSTLTTHLASGDVEATRYPRLLPPEVSGLRHVPNGRPLRTASNTRGVDTASSGGYHRIA